MLSIRWAQRGLKHINVEERNLMDEINMVRLARRHAKVFSGELKGYSLMSPISIGFKRKNKFGRWVSPILISFRTSGTVEGRCGKAKVIWPMTLDMWDRKVNGEFRAIEMEKIRRDHEKARRKQEEEERNMKAELATQLRKEKEQERKGKQQKEREQDEETYFCRR